MGKNKALAPTLPRIRYMSCFDLTHAPVATAARAAATGLVSMSTRHTRIQFFFFSGVLATERCLHKIGAFCSGFPLYRQLVRKTTGVPCLG